MQYSGNPEMEAVVNVRLPDDQKNGIKTNRTFIVRSFLSKGNKQSLILRQSSNATYRRKRKTVIGQIP
jgi:hypothetical protein